MYHQYPVVWGSVFVTILYSKPPGGGRSLAPRYRLEIAVREAVQGVMVNRSGDEAGKVYSLTADFKLLTIADNITDGDDDNPVLLEGKSHAKAAFNQQKSIFSNMRGRVDAENRAAAVIADNIKTRIAAFLAR
jgi:LPS-assembly lipoprotein